MYTLNGEVTVLNNFYFCVLSKWGSVCSPFQSRPILKACLFLGSIQEVTKVVPLHKKLWTNFEVCPYTLTLLHSERPKLYTMLAFLSVIGLNSLPVYYNIISEIIIL